jgi:iron complex transport system ATP-binding protein
VALPGAATPRRALDELTLTFGGGWTAVVGPNGAGKTTLLRALAGLLPPAAGAVSLDGRALAEWPAAERGRAVAWLGQGAADTAAGDLTARDLVALGRLPHFGLFGTPGAADRAAIDAAMHETDCSALAARRLSQLSGGERQRVALARVLSTGARTLLLDEPTAHLDAPHQRALLQGLRRRAAEGVAVLTVLHDLTLALAADRVLALDRGRVVADGAPADPALRRALGTLFEGGFEFVAVTGEAGAAPRWVAVPVLHAGAAR